MGTRLMERLGDTESERVVELVVLGRNGRLNGRFFF